MQQAGRTAYRYLVALFVAGVIVQFFLAGLGAFRTQHDAGAGTAVTDRRFADNFSVHVALGPRWGSSARSSSSPRSPGAWAAAARCSRSPCRCSSSCRACSRTRALPASARSIP